MEFPPKLLEKLNSILKNSIESKNKYSQAFLTKLSNDLKSIEKKLNRILDLFIDESITKTEYDKIKYELSVQKDNIESQIAKLNHHLNKSEKE